MAAEPNETAQVNEIQKREFSDCFVYYVFRINWKALHDAMRDLEDCNPAIRIHGKEI